VGAEGGERAGGLAAIFLACDTQQVRTGSGRDWLAAVAMLLAAASWGGLLTLLSL
jgi:ABC-type uncharacterized transport system permease subunit